MNIALEEREEKMTRVQWRTHAGVMQALAICPFVEVCMTACFAAREVIPGNGATGAVSALFQHLAIGAEP